MFNYDKITFDNSVNNTIELIFTEPNTKPLFNGRFVDADNKVISVEGLDFTITDKQSGSCKLTITTKQGRDYSSVYGFKLTYSYIGSGVANTTIPIEVIKPGWDINNIIIPKEGGRYTAVFGISSDYTWGNIEYINCSEVNVVNCTRSKEITFSVSATPEDRVITVKVNYGNTSSLFRANQKIGEVPTVTIDPNVWSTNTTESIYKKFNVITDGTIEHIDTPNLPTWISRNELIGRELWLTAYPAKSTKDVEITVKGTVRLEGWGNVPFEIQVTQAGHYIEIPEPNIRASFEEQTIQIPYIRHWVDPSWIKAENSPTWMEFTFGDQISVKLSKNTGSARQARVKLNVSTIQSLYITIIQLEEGSKNVPIWKDTVYIEKSNNWIEYHLDDANNNVLYAGKAYPYPSNNTVEILVNDIASNFLKPMDWPTNDGFNISEDYSKFFSLKTSTNIIRTYIFNNDWSYKENPLYTNSPCNIVDPRQLFIVSGDSGYKITYGDNTIQFTNLYTYRLDLSNITIPCGSKISVYKDNVIIKEYTVANGKDYVLYYTNSVGGWDFITVKGNATRKDNVTSSLYERRPIRPSKEFGSIKYLNTITPSWSLNTGYIKGNISELVSSLNVYLYDLNTKDLIPVNVTTTSAEYLNYTNNGKHFTNYTVEVEASQKNFRK